MKINGAGALVVGGASGLGEACTRRLHAEGAKVTIADVNGEKGDALADELGEGVQFLQADVTKPEEVQAAVDAAVTSGGLLKLTDDRGRVVLVPGALIGYVEIGAPERGKVGFGAI